VEPLVSSTFSMFNPITTGSHLPKLRISAIALHLCCIAFKVARGRPISFHLLHIAQEFGLGRLAETAKREARATFSPWMRKSCAAAAPQIQASKLLVLLAALTFALAQETTAQSGLPLEGVTVSDLGNPNDSLFKVPAGGAVPSGSYVLDVVSGSGDGIHPTGKRVIVRADPPPAGQKFAGWTGDMAILSNPFLPTTTAIMPSMNVSISATYADPEGAAGTGPSSVVTGKRETAVALMASPSPSPTPSAGCKAEIDKDNILFEFLTTVIQAPAGQIRPDLNSERTDINYKVTATFSASGAWTGTLNVQITQKFSVSGPNIPPGGKTVEAPIHEKTVTVSGAAGETKSVPNQDSIRVSVMDSFANHPKIAKAHGGTQARVIGGQSDLKLVATAKVVDTSSPCTNEAEPVTKTPPTERKIVKIISRQ
jgi:hypothetical protein